jgi:hypothetical protein
MKQRLLAWVSGREQRKGLRPRDAAILIVVVWLLAIVVFGIAEHLVEPKTFPTVWLGMWWSLVTVTTVGYGDFVPVDAAGRIIASFLLLGGLAFLTVKRIFAFGVDPWCPSGYAPAVARSLSMYLTMATIRAIGITQLKIVSAR